MRRTTATTDYLKECMGTALLELMKEKPIEKISIEEMTAKADVRLMIIIRSQRLTCTGRSWMAQS